MNCCASLTCSVLFISMILFNILFWNDNWSYSENDSQGIWDLCFKAGGYSCCQSFSDRGEDTPDWFIHFQKALYSACFSIAVTMILLPYWITIKRDNDKGEDKFKAEECVAMLLITACFTSAICLSIASWKYGSNFKSVDSLEYHYLHTSFWIAGVCEMFYSFVGIGMTILYIHRRGRAGYCCHCLIICGKALIAVTDGCVGGCRSFVIGCCAMKCRRREARRASTDYMPESIQTVGNNALHGIAQLSRDNVQYSSTCENNPISHNAVLHDSENGHKKETEEVFKRRWDDMPRSLNLKIVELDINRANHSYEYNEIEKAFLRNNNGFVIIQIFRIQNCRMYAAHMHFKKIFMETAKIFHPQSYRKLLWHGTSKEATKNINSYGFNRNYQGKNACLYGDGVYFATKPSYSCNDKYSVPDSNDIKRVYLCSVFVGRYTKEKEGMKDPPMDGNGARYDSTVDDPENPQIHVSFFDNQAYAQYLILFSSTRY